MHGWVGQCLPDVSGHVSQSDVRLTYRNVFLGSHLTCQYQYVAGSARSPTACLIDDGVCCAGRARRRSRPIPVARSPSSGR